FVLDEEPRHAERGAEPMRMDERGPTLAERQRRLAVEERHQLAVAPHVRLATLERVAPPGARSVEVVAGQERCATRAQVLRLVRIVRSGPARDRALQVTEI